MTHVNNVLNKQHFIFYMYQGSGLLIYLQVEWVLTRIRMTRGQ